MEKPGQSLPNSQGGAQQQNININISYNLNTHKIPKAILGEKKPVLKSKKIHTPVMQSIGNQFFSNMAFNSLNEGKKSLKKQNLSKKSNQSSLAVKEPRHSNDKKPTTKKKKTKQTLPTEPNLAASDAIMEYYNPLANNSKHFLKRNIQSPDIFKVEYNRKLKTEISNYEPNDSTFKKLKRSTGHMKQMQSGLLGKNMKINNFMKDTGFNFVGQKIPGSISTILKKPSLSSSKTPKNRKSAHQLKQKQKRMYTQQNDPSSIIPSHIPQTRHNKSCMLYSTKKANIIPEPHLIQTAQHILSTYVSTNSNPKLPRKRAQSAYSFNKNGKELVSKLLNMSMISSELGSSQLITSERLRSGRGDPMKKKIGLKVDQFDQFNHYGKEQVEILEGENHKIKGKGPQEEALPGNALRQYLNSIDLRIIKNIEDDTANITLSKPQKPQRQQQLSTRQKQLQKQQNSISFNTSNKPSQRSQPASQHQSPNDVISFYNKLFSNALENKRIQQEQEKYLDSANLGSQRQSLSIDLSSSQKVKKEKFVIQGFDHDSEEKFDEEISGSINQTKEVYEFVKSSKPQGSRKLNFQHYKDLLNKKSQQQKEKSTQGMERTLIKGFNFKLMGCDNESYQNQDQNEFDFVPFKNPNSNQSQSIPNSQSHHFAHPQQQQLDMQQKAIIQLIDKSFKPSSSPSSGSSLSQFREEQIERWNNVHKMMESKGKRGVEFGDKDIISQLKKQAMVNRQWREYGDGQEEGSEGEEENLQGEQRHEDSEQRDEESDSNLIFQQRINLNESFTPSNHPNTTSTHAPSSIPPSTKQAKTSSRKKLHIQQPSYNQVCWQYNSDELDKEIQSYHQQKNIKNQTKKPKPSRHAYKNSPNNFSEDGNGSGEEQYDSKKYSQVTVCRDKVLEGEIDFDDDFLGENQGFIHHQSKENAKEDQNGNSLIDSLVDGEEGDDMSFEEKEIGSDHRWINSNFAQQSFIDTQGQIKKFIEKKTQKQVQTQQEKQKESDNQQSEDYLECDLSSFGVNNKNNLTGKNITKVDSKDSESLKQIPILQKQPLQQQKAEFHQALQMLESDQKSQQVIESHFKLTINGKQTKQKITLQVSQSNHEKVNQQKANFNKNNNNDNKDAFSQLRRKRLTHIVEDIILEMIRQFAKDISYILKKSSYQKRSQQQQMQQNSSPFRSYKQSSHQQHELSPFSKQAEALEVMNSSQVSRKQQLKKSQFVGKCFGIDTSFTSVQKYLKEFKEYLLRDENLKKLIIKNINKDIGPNSLEILSYLRPEYDNIDNVQGNEFEGNQQALPQEDPCEDEDGLFVVPSQAFSQFQTYLEQQIQEQNKSLQPEKQANLTQKQKRNTNFWHRGIYQSWNQFLDYERPYGINGKPYEWVKQKKKFREVQLEEVQKKLQKGIDKLLQGISLPSGIIYDKYDLPPMYADLNEQQKMYLNEERLSRMLAIELFESQETWINYNDEMAELLVELGRIIQDRVFFQITTEMKKVFRKRNLLVGVGGGEKVEAESDRHESNLGEEQEDEENDEQDNYHEDNHKWLVDEQVDEEQQDEEED